MEAMEIRSSFDDLTRWPELKPGILFYVPEADGVRLATKVEHHEHGRVFHPCLFFNRDLRLTDPGACQSEPLIALQKAALVPTRFGGLKSLTALGELVQTDHTLLLNVLNQKGEAITVQLSTGKTLGSWPVRPEALVSFAEWKIVLPSPLSPERYDVIFEWPLPKKARRASPQARPGRRSARGR